MNNFFVKTYVHQLKGTTLQYCVCEFLHLVSIMFNTYGNKAW
jgi:hypothetical protein